MTRINQIWEELENDTSFAHGLLLRRYSGSVLPDVFIALKNPEKFRCIAATISDTISIDLNLFINLRDISVELIPDVLNSNRNTLVFKLINNQHRDIFSVLCEDLILSISQVTNEKQLVKELLSRFDKWRSLFDKASSVGLGPEEQRGLYGELYFLRKFFSFSTDKLGVINSWVGPEKKIRDFEFGNWAVEVKTSHGNNHQKVRISSERQLDKSNLNLLYLFHLSQEVRQQSGETLNQIVDFISGEINNDFGLSNRFKSKLLEAGYFEQHRSLYESNGYFVRQETFYEVANDFPRIEESDIRRGVGDVDYTIILSQCTKFVKPEAEVFQNIVFNE